MTTVDPDEVVAPPWISDLPRDPRGFLVPAETPWDNGVPLLAMLGTEWRIAMSLQRSCAVCGYPIHPDRRGYRMHTQGDAANVRMNERDHSHDLGPPGHKSCMMFSAFACPYFRGPKARLGKDSLIAPGAKRGSLAALFGFERSGLLLADMKQDLLDPAAPKVYYDYMGLVEDIRFHHASDLLPLYADAVAEDTPWIDTTAERALWSDSPADSTALVAYLRRWSIAVTGKSATSYPFPWLLDGRMYRGLDLPLS